MWRACLTRRATSGSSALFLRWPIFQSGRLRAQVDVADARREQAVVRYRQSILLALEDVETALVGFDAERAERGTVPNFSAFLRQALGRRWHWLDPESQAFHFRPEVLGQQLQAAGFRVEMWTSEGQYGGATLTEHVGEEKATEMERLGRGSELGFIAQLAC